MADEPEKPDKPPTATPSATPGATPAAAPAPKPPGPTAAAATAARPAAPTKAAAGADLSRRSFLTALSFAWTAFAAAMGACGAGLGRFFFPNVLYEPPSVFKVGRPEEFTIGAVDERYKQSFGVWIVRDETGFYALSTVCTHLGCTPNWLSAERKFKCPCHGSGFYIDGINFEGPAPRPLERYRILLSDDGQIKIDKSRKFQQEKGQWEDPDSYLKLA